jgi:antitoxin HigA-1
MSRNQLLKGLKPMHPGEMLREDVLPALGRTKSEIASLLGISRQTLFDILRERQPVAPAMALRFGKLLGNGPNLWIDLQRAYDLHVAEKELGRALAKIRPCQRRSYQSAGATRRMRPDELSVAR